MAKSKKQLKNEQSARMAMKEYEATAQQHQAMAGPRPTSFDPHAMTRSIMAGGGPRRRKPRNMGDSYKPFSPEEKRLLRKGIVERARATENWK